MKLYLITRTDRTDYNEYFGLVVRANSKEDALAIATGHSGFSPDGSNLVVVRIRESGRRGVILSDFHAG